MARKERFRRGLDRELALFEEMKAQIHNLEEQLNLAPRFSLEKKTALENALVEEKADKVKHIEDNRATQATLVKAKEQITTLESEKDKLSGTVSSLQYTISSLNADLNSSREFRSRLSNVIKVIEQKKAGNFESDMVLARRHTEEYPG